MRSRRLGVLAIALAASVLTSVAAANEALFEQHCAACHQADASGIPGLAPPLTGPHWACLGGDGGRYVLQVLWQGLNGSIEVQGAAYRGAMPPMRQQSAADMAALASHLRRLNAAVVGDAATPVDASALDEVQRRTERSAPRRAALLGGGASCAAAR